MEKQSIGTLQVIFKIVEKCNLNCEYCYYYSGSDLKNDKRPAVISRETIIAVTEFLKSGCQNISIGRIQIIFHGGEPTLMKPALFDWMCGHLFAELSDHIDLSFSIQTNAVHVSQAWLEVLAKYDVSIGVSIDGNKRFNDVYRLDHKGRGSHDRISNNIRVLNDASKDGKIRPIGLVCVLNSKFDYREIYRHFTEDLGVSSLNFLLPDRNRDADPKLQEEISSYGDALCVLFDEWLEHGTNSVKVRQFSELLQNFAGKLEYRDVPKGYVDNRIIVIHSDGDVAVDDTLMPATEWYQTSATANVREVSMAAWFSQQLFEDLSSARSKLPEECVGCRWSAICRGGDVENRFSKSNGFVGKSIYCSALFNFYNHVAATLVDGGYPSAQLEASIRGRVEEPV